MNTGKTETGKSDGAQRQAKHQLKLKHAVAELECLKQDIKTAKGIIKSVTVGFKTIAVDQANERALSFGIEQIEAAMKLLDNE